MWPIAIHTPPWERLPKWARVLFVALIIALLVRLFDTIGVLARPLPTPPWFPPTDYGRLRRLVTRR